MSGIPAPKAVTKVRIGGFTLKIYAYRQLTQDEIRLAVAMYKRQYRLKKFPASGTGELITLFGYNPEDGL